MPRASLVSGAARASNVHTRELVVCVRGNMYKYLAIVLVWSAFCSAKPWQMLKPVPGYIPVYIQHGDQPLEEINLELAEAFHAIPSGRSASKNSIAAGEDKEDNSPETVEDLSSETDVRVSVEKVNNGGYSPPDGAKKRAYEKKTKKAGSGNIQIIPIDA